MDISNTEVKIRGVAQDQARAEQEADGKDGADEHILGDMYVFRPVQEMGGALQNPGADGLLQVRDMREGLTGGAYSEGEMPCNKKDGVTEVERAVQMVVVQNDRRREDDPDGNDGSGRDLWFLPGSLCGDRIGQIITGVLLF